MSVLRPTSPYKPIGDYGLISGMHSCALVSKDGSIDWCCFPRFDSPSIFGRILDWRKGGYFQVTVRGVRSSTRRYLPGTNVLETTFHAETGVAKLTDFMPVHPNFAPEESVELDPHHQVVRILECVSGSVQFTMECYPRFDYGTIVPHAEVTGPHNGFAHGGADSVSIYCSAPLREVNSGFESDGVLRIGEKLRVAVTHHSIVSHHVDSINADGLETRLKEVVHYWEQWSQICTYEGEYRDDVLRSALTIKALTYAPSGGLVAAPTTSLPEVVGGVRNWDYRFTWIRDATFAIYSLVIIGYKEEARAFKDWLEWSTTGRARDLQIMYGLRGERRLTEVEIPGLEGYRRSRPVRIGNAAYSQFQLDIYGEVMDSAHMYRKFVGEIDPGYWEYLRRVINFVIDHWREPDEGIWETRGGRQQFVFSKVWCWVALDRAIKAARALDLPGEIEKWRKVRAEIREEVMSRGYDAQRGAFVQSYGSKALDAANLMLPLVGFIKADDPRMRSTIQAIERELTSPLGFVYRYKDLDDGLGGEEGTFTMCTFWLVDDLIALGEIDRARTLFDKIRGCANDLGLFSEEVDGNTGEMLGNFPQAFSHMSLINTAIQLQRAEARGTAVGASEAPSTGS